MDAFLIMSHLIIAIVLAVLSLGLTIHTFRQRKFPNHAFTSQFWIFHNVFEATVLLQAVLGIMLVIHHVAAKDALHFIYGGVLLLLILIGRGLRPGRALNMMFTRDYARFQATWSFFVVDLLSFLMIGRAITTGVWGF